MESALTESTFYPRNATIKLQAALTDTPVVCLLGPRQSGKTTLVKALEPTRAYITLDDSTVLQFARQDPDGFIQSLPDQVTLDEVQRAPELLVAIKSAVDQRRTPGRFLLTGSANLLLLPAVQESLAGRMEVLHLHTLSASELHHRPPHFLSTLLDGQFDTAITGPNTVLTGVAEMVCQGGYPEPLQRTPTRARQWHRQYLNAIVQRDVKDIANIQDEDAMLRLLELLSLRTATLLNINSLANDLGIQRATAEKYLCVLERLFLVRRLAPWHHNQATRLIKTPKIHIVDSGLAATLSKLTAENWLLQGTEFGHLLESFVVQQIVCQADCLDDDIKLSHYRDKDQVEVDLVIERGNDVWGVEVKKASSIDRNKDGAGLGRLADRAGKNFKSGVLLYTGGHTLPLARKGIMVAPLSSLWS